MEKTLTIDGKVVRFKSTAGTLRRYKEAFGREFLADVVKASKMDMSKIETLDFDCMYQIIWACAKTADDTIQDMLPWLDNFEEMDVTAVYEEVMEIVKKSLKTDRKNV